MEQELAIRHEDWEKYKDQLLKAGYEIVKLEPNPDFNSKDWWIRNKPVAFLKMPERIAVNHINNFGELYSSYEGILMSCRAIAPGLSLQDLVLIYSEEEKQGNNLAGNPSKWGVSRGVKAVVEAVIQAMCNARTVE